MLRNDSILLTRGSAVGVGARDFHDRINYLIALYAAWIFIPVVVITGAMDSLGVAYHVKINDDDIKVKEMVSV